MKKGLKYTMAAAAGAGAVMLLSKKTKENEHKQKEISKKREDERKDYRNTERGKYEKNSKGIYYSNGNYEAFARPEKPEGVDGKNAYIVGSGLASLAAACFLVRDGQMKGSHIHILEAMDIAGGRQKHMDLSYQADSARASSPRGSIRSVPLYKRAFCSPTNSRSPRDGASSPVNTTLSGSSYHPRGWTTNWV